MITPFMVLYELVFRFTDALWIMLCLRPKHNKILTFLILFIPDFVLNLMSAARNFENPLITVSTYVLLIVSCFILFENKVLEKIVAPVAEILIGTILMLVYLAFANFVDITRAFEEDRMGLLIMLAVNTLFCGAGVLFWRKKTGKIHISFRYTNSFLLLPVSQIVMCYAFQSFLDPVIWNENATFFTKENSMILFNVAMVLTVIADILVFLTYDKISKNQMMERELRERDFRERVMMEHYKSLEENALQMRKLRHDFANAIEIANCMAESKSEEARRSAEKMLGNMEEELRNIHIERYCRNELINSIISEKARQCREKGIEAVFSVVIPDKLGFEEFDLCRALINIIDNSIEAAEHSETDKNVFIEISYGQGALTIASENASVPHFDKGNNKEHGYGQKILNDLAKKYGGSYTAEDDGETYRAKLVMREQAES